MPMLVNALRARDRQLGLNVAQEERKIVPARHERPVGVLGSIPSPSVKNATPVERGRPICLPSALARARPA